MFRLLWGFLKRGILIHLFVVFLSLSSAVFSLSLMIFLAHVLFHLFGGPDLSMYMS